MTDDVNTLMPTFTCFTDALEYCELRVIGTPAIAHSETFLLVHGLATANYGTECGLPYAHGWVEEEIDEGWICWGSAMYCGQRVFYACPRDEFYQEFGVTDFTRYTMREAWEHNRDSGHYGPWLEKYQVLCSSEHRIVGKSKGNHDQKA